MWDSPANVCIKTIDLYGFDVSVARKFIEHEESEEIDGQEPSILLLGVSNLPRKALPRVKGLKALHGSPYAHPKVKPKFPSISRSTC